MLIFVSIIVYLIYIMNNIYVLVHELIKKIKNLFTWSTEFLIAGSVSMRHLTTELVKLGVFTSYIYVYMNIIKKKKKIW